jgi:hypothetical protein
MCVIYMKQLTCHMKVLSFYPCRYSRGAYDRLNYSSTSLHFLNYRLLLITTGGPGSSVGIATGYGLDGPGIESRWGRDFSKTSRLALRPTQPPVKWIPGLSPSSSEVKKE